MPAEALPVPTIAGTYGVEGIIPVGVGTFTLTFGPYTDALGVAVPGTITGKLYPADPITGKRIRLTHISSGQVILPQDVPVTVTAGTGSVGPLPHTDDPTISPVGFAYRVEWQVASSKPSPGNRTIAVPAAAGSTVDFDLLQVADAAPGVVIPAPGVTSVNGKTGVVSLTATDVGAQPAGSYATTADVTTASTADRARANHTGTQAASTITGLATVATSGAYTDLTAKPTIPTVGAAGAGAAVALSSTDATVTNSRTPTIHAPTHASGGTDPITPAAIGADVSGAATSAQAFAIQRANHTGTQSADTLTDGTTNKAFLATERTKLTGVATGATANSPDATLLARANHTGTQAASTVTGLATVATSGAYADLTGSPLLAPPPISGNYYFPYSQGTSSTSNTLGTGTLRVTPVLFSTAFTIVRLGSEITATGDVGSKLRLGIYADNGSGYPSTLVLDAGQIAGDSATVQELTVSKALTAGIYWIGAVVQSVTTTQPTVRTANIMHPNVLVPLGTTIPSAGAAGASLGTGSITGALPGTFPAGATGGGQVARLFYKIA
jgi:hypothetical protein